MPVEFWTGGPFNKTYEREAQDQLQRSLSERFENRDDAIQVAFNVAVPEADMDMVVIKSDCVIIVDFKHCESAVHATRNGNWIIKGGGTLPSNPFKQVSDFRYAFSKYLFKHRFDFLRKQKAEMFIDYKDFLNSVRSVVATWPKYIPESDTSELGHTAPWFQLTGIDLLPQLIDNITGQNLFLDHLATRALVNTFCRDRLSSRSEASGAAHQNRAHRPSPAQASPPSRARESSPPPANGSPQAASTTGSSSFNDLPGNDSKTPPPAGSEARATADTSPSRPSPRQEPEPPPRNHQRFPGSTRNTAPKTGGTLGRDPRRSARSAYVVGGALLVGASLIALTFYSIYRPHNGRQANDQNQLPPAQGKSSVTQTQPIASPPRLAPVAASTALPKKSLPESASARTLPLVASDSSENARAFSSDSANALQRTPKPEEASIETITESSPQVCVPQSPANGFVTDVTTQDFPGWLQPAMMDVGRTCDVAIYGLHIPSSVRVAFGSAPAMGHPDLKVDVKSIQPKKVIVSITVPNTAKESRRELFIDSGNGFRDAGIRLTIFSPVASRILPIIDTLPESLGDGTNLFRERQIGGVSGIRVFATELPKSIEFRLMSEGRTWYTAIDVDVNHNGRVDPMLDVSYGSMLDNLRRPCNSYLLADGAKGPCGAFTSAEKYEYMDHGTRVEYIHVIPKSELSTTGGSAWITLKAYNLQTGQSGQTANLRYDFPP